jgi:hypothetical protein
MFVYSVGQAREGVCVQPIVAVGVELNRLPGDLQVSSQKVGVNPCGCPLGQAQDLPLPQDIEKIHLQEGTFLDYDVYAMFDRVLP